MTLSIYLAFVAASVALILLPGPNVAVIVSNSVSHGRRAGLMTVAGTSLAIVCQLALTVAGLSGVMALAAEGFEVLRWAGVIYLVYLGISAFREPAALLPGHSPAALAPRQMLLRGFLVSLTNPKTLMFYAAFLPQFVSNDGDRTEQLVILASTFLILSAVLDCGWALLADRARGLLGMSGRLVSRLSGAIFLTAAAGLALARRPM